MTTRRTLSLTLPPTLVDAAASAALRQNLGLPEFLRGAILTATTDAPDCTGRPRRAAADLARVFDDALNWLDLQRRLRARGLVLRLDQAGKLWVHVWPQDIPLAPAAALGQSLAALCLHFRAAFPGDVRDLQIPTEPRRVI